MKYRRLAMRTLLPGLVLGVAVLPATARADCGAPAAIGDGWAVATPESVGIASGPLCGIGEDGLHSVVVIRHGKLVYERYFTAADTYGDGRNVSGIIPFGPETRHQLMSVTKSVASLVFGAAAGRGLINGDVDQSVLLSFFPEYTDLRGEKDAIKLRHLLTMSTGLDVNTSVVWNASPRIPLNKPLLVPPGRRFVYADEITQLISTVLQKATGQRFDDLARTLIFEPLGISDVIWTPIDSGNVAVWAHLYMRPRDMAKLGQLVLQRGLWNGQQLVPAAYIDAATSPQIAALSRGSYAYGYQFWIDTRPFCRVGTTPCETQVALSWGNGGQHFYVVPALDLVVVTTAGLYGTSVRSDTMPLAILDTVLSAANFDHVPTITPQSGWWWAPSAPGMGLGIETSGSNAAVGAYLYDTDGSAVWYIAMGALSGSSFSGSMVEYAGGQTLGGSYRANSVNRIAGTMSIAFTSATTGTLTWPGGSVAIERFNITSGGVSAGSASGDPQKGWWWGASESGRGYFIETQGANRTLFMAAYMYDTDGSAVWYSASGDLQTSVSGTGRTFTGTLSEYANGQTLGGAYQAPTVMATRGTISIEFTTTTTATLTLPSGAQVALTRFTF